MRSLSTLAALATVAVAAPLAAQQTRAIPTGAARVVATYDFVNVNRGAAMPRSVTVADSAGTILARAELPGQVTAIPLTVTVIETNLILQGQTPDGVLTLVLNRQNEGGQMKLTNGTWTLGSTQGTLRGTAKP